MSTFTIQSCNARTSLLGFARMQTAGPLLFPAPAGKEPKLVGEPGMRKSSLAPRAREPGGLDISGELHEIKNNESTRIEARNRAIVRLRNDTVFARFGVAAKIYENVGGEKSRGRGEGAGRASSGFVSLAHLGDVPFFLFLHSSFSEVLLPFGARTHPRAHAHAHTHTDVLQAIPVHGEPRARTLAHVPSIALPPYPKRALSRGYIGRSRVGR